MNNETIAAIATPPGRGGIGIIKISGSEAIDIAGKIFYSKKNADSALGTRHSALSLSHHLYYGHIINDQGKQLDEVLICVMKAPHSYTGEDIVEIQAHAGSIVLKNILELVLKKGARLAEPGEFTKRAYLNGRIDLTQAEAVADIIHAKSERALEMASAQLDGGLRLEIENIRQSLLAILSQIEAGIDFPEDIGDEISADEIIRTLDDAIIARLNNLISAYNAGHFVKEGLKVLIAGKPNVGKSSLMNRLLEKDRVIVTPVAGTTRDLIEESLMIGQIEVILADSAGLHDSDDPIEQIGIQKTYQYLDDADLVLMMLDASQDSDAEDQKIYERFCHKPLIAVMNKSDLVTEKPASPFDLPTVYISALHNIGIDDLKYQVEKHCSGADDIEEYRLIPSLRHKLSLEQSRTRIESAISGLQDHIPFEIISIDLQAGISALDEITGQQIRDDVLDQIFSRFCIGK